MGKDLFNINKRAIYEEKGIAVVLAMFMLVLMMLLAFCFISMTNVEVCTVHNDNDYIRALYVAEAGITEILFRANYPWEDQVTVNDSTFYPYIPIFTVTDDRGTESPVDDLYWHNDKIDNNGNGLIDEWGEIDPAWTANIWFTSASAVPTAPAATTTRKYNYFPTTLDLTTSNISNLLRYSGTISVT